MSRDFPRSRRIEDQIQRLLSDALRSDVRDPRLRNAIITAVRVSRDLSVAWIYYTVLQAEGEPEPLDEAFRSAEGFLRSRLARDLTVRRVPELRFEFDNTDTKARAMDQLIAEANRTPASRPGNDDSEADD